MRSGIHMSLGHYGGTTYAKVMSMGGFNCLIEAGDTIQTLLEHHFPKRSDPLTIPGVVTAEWKIVQALCTGNSIRNVKTPCCVSRSMVLEIVGLHAQDLIQDVYALGVNKPGNGEDFLLFDIEELTCDCGSKGCPKFLGFDGWLTIWGKCWVSFIDKRRGWICTACRHGRCWIFMSRHYISAITDATTLGTEEEAEVIDASALLGPKKHPTSQCTKLTVDYMKLELEMHVCAGYALQDTTLVQLCHSLKEIWPAQLLSLSPQKTFATKGVSQGSSRTSSNSNISVPPAITPTTASGKRPAPQPEYGIIIGIMPAGITPEDIRSFLRLLAKKTNSAVDPWVNVTKHALERTSTLASPYTVIIVNHDDSESAEAIKDVLSLLNNTTAGVGVLLPLDNRWQQWLREGGNLEISVRNAERLPLDLPMTKLLEEKPIISIADSNVFYFVCPLASCTLLKFDTFKEVNMHIIEKHSTEDGVEELPKGKKMEKEEATAAVSSIKVVNQRIDFAAAQRAMEGSTSVTPATISVKMEGVSTSAPTAHADPSSLDMVMSGKTDDDEDYFQVVTEQLEEDSF